MRLEERACGPAAIDINYLREHTNNEGLSEEREAMLWTILMSFDQGERIKYL